MAAKTLTPTQLFNHVQRLDNIDITQLDFTKLPSGFDDAKAFEKSITKTLNNVKSQFATAYKTYETNARNEKFNEVLAPWIDRFDGNLDKALEALQIAMKSETTASTIRPEMNEESSEERGLNEGFNRNEF